MKKGNIKKFDFRGYFNTPSHSEIKSQILPMALYAFNEYCKNNKQVIDNYNYWKEKIEELNYRIDFTYKLSVVKNREANKSILARVKWQYKFKGEYKKPPSLGVYIGSLKDYPKGLEESNIDEVAKAKIEEYLVNKVPLIFQDIDGNEYKV